MLSIPNIYESKYVKYYILVPMLLMVLGIYFSTKIILDSSLSGGVSIIMQTNSTINPSQLATAIANKLNVPAPAIENSPGGLQVTLTINQSLANAETALLSFYSNRQNNSAAQLNETALSLALNNATNKGNKTLINQIAQQNSIINKSLANMKISLTNELSSLTPFIGTAPFNSGSISNMSSVAQSSYALASAAYKNRIITGLQSIIPISSYSYQQLTPTLGRFFLSQLTQVIIITFILISIVVFIIFRSPAPSIAVIFGAINDIVVALGGMGLFKIPLGLASIGGLLMLVGYSIDTDVLTSVRILKRREGTPESRAFSSMRTGVTMTATAIVSFAVLFAVSIFTYVPTYYEISGVVLFGLVGDVLTTWLGDATIVLLYKKRKDRVK